MVGLKSLLLLKRWLDVLVETRLWPTRDLPISNHLFYIPELFSDERIEVDVNDSLKFLVHRIRMISGDAK